jgi:hypothetical protein
VDPRAGLDDVEERKFLTLPGLELRPLGRPARIQSLYRLSYRGSYRVRLSEIKGKVTVFVRSNLGFWLQIAVEASMSVFVQCW